jgi:hypothetical protein
MNLVVVLLQLNLLDSCFLFQRFVCFGRLLEQEAQTTTADRMYHFSLNLKSRILLQAMRQYTRDVSFFL